MFDATWHMLIMLAPWLLLGAVIAGILHVLLPPGLLARQLDGSAGVFKAVGLGVPLPLCSCGVIPAGIGLKRDGAGDGPAIAFLISTPQTGVDSLFVSAGLLGWPFALFKVAAAVVTGIIGGLGVQALADGSASASAPPTATDDARGVRAFAEHSMQVIRSIWGWLVVGVVTSAAITVFVPPGVFASIGLSGPFAPIMVLLVALPLYVCAVASVPIAAGLVAAGMPVGAALVFLMAGPATNVATIGAIGKTFGRRVLGVYMGVLIAGSLVAALLFEWLLPDQTLAGPTHMEHTAPWEIASAWILLALLVWFAADDLWRRLRPTRRSAFEIPVQGMTCNGCVRRLEARLKTIDGVESVVVHLDPGHAAISGTAPRAEIEAAIRESGYQAG